MKSSNDREEDKVFISFVTTPEKAIGLHLPKEALYFIRTAVLAGVACNTDCIAHCIVFQAVSSFRASPSVLASVLALASVLELEQAHQQREMDFDMGGPPDRMVDACWWERPDFLLKPSLGLETECDNKRKPRSEDPRDGFMHLGSRLFHVHAHPVKPQGNPLALTEQVTILVAVILAEDMIAVISMYTCWYNHSFDIAGNR